MKSNHTLILICLLCFINKGQAQVNNAISPIKNSIVKPLQIGHKIPLKLWHSPLIEVNGTKKTQSKTFGDLKSKWILLDFWSSWCGPCIRSLKEINEIQKQFPDKIKVVILTRDDSKRLTDFMGESSYAKGVTLPFYSESPYLLALFPHISISHIVIIDNNGYVKAITGSKGVNKDKIGNLIDGKPVDFPIKNDFSGISDN